MVNNIAFYNGVEWSTLGGGISPWTRDIEIWNNKLFVSGVRDFFADGLPSVGIAMYDFGDLTANKDGLKVEGQGFTIGNYPNPFSQNTTIWFTIDNPEPVKIVINDLSGRLLKEFSFEKNFPGTNRIEVNLSDIQKGFYICSIIQANSLKSSSIMVKTE